MVARGSDLVSGTDAPGARNVVCSPPRRALEARPAKAGRVCTTMRERAGRFAPYAPVTMLNERAPPAAAFMIPALNPGAKNNSHVVYWYFPAPFTAPPAQIAC